MLELSDPMPHSRMEPARVEQPRVEREMARVAAPQPVAQPAPQPVAPPQPVAQPAPHHYAPEPEPAPQPAQPPRPAPVEPAMSDEPILSQRAAAASLGSLETLSKLLVKPEPESDGTLEGLVREMPGPMLRSWLDTHLPEMVETMVAREIAKITAQMR